MNSPSTEILPSCVITPTTAARDLAHPAAILWTQSGHPGLVEVTWILSHVRTVALLCIALPEQVDERKHITTANADEPAVISTRYALLAQER